MRVVEWLKPTDIDAELTYDTLRVVFMPLLQRASELVCEIADDVKVVFEEFLF